MHSASCVPGMSHTNRELGAIAASVFMNGQSLEKNCCRQPTPASNACSDSKPSPRLGQNTLAERTFPFSSPSVALTEFVTANGLTASPHQCKCLGTSKLTELSSLRIFICSKMQTHGLTAEPYMLKHLSCWKKCFLPYMEC